MVVLHDRENNVATIAYLSYYLDSWQPVIKDYLYIYYKPIAFMGGQVS